MKANINEIVKSGFICSHCKEVDIGNGFDLSRFSGKRSDKVCRDCKPMYKKAIGKLVRDMIKQAGKE